MSQHLIREAFERFHAQDWKQAEILLRQAVEAKPEAVEPRVHLANLLRILNRADEAVPLLEPILEKPTPPLEVRKLLFDARRAQGDFAEACRLAEGFADSDELDSDRRREIVDCARRAGIWALALRLARQVNDRKLINEIRSIRGFSFALRALPPVLRRAWARFLVRRFERRSRWRITRVLLESARLADPGNARWPRRLGQLCRRTRDIYDPRWEEEKNWYQLALEIDPTDREARDGLLQTLFDMGRWQEVLDCLDADPAPDVSDRSNLFRAACSANLGRKEEADSLYESLREEEQSDFAWFCRALIAFDDQRWEDANQLLVFKTDRPGLNVLVDFFRQVSRMLNQGYSVEEIDGQTVVDEMMGIEPVTENMPEPEPDREKRGPGACILCGHEGPRVLLWRDRTTGWPRTRCPRCTMISVNPLPSRDAIQRLYDHDARKDLSLLRIYRKALLDILDASAENCRRLPSYQELTDWGDDFSWEEFEQSIQGEKRSLDVGCSAGRVVEMLRMCGWRAEGMDVDPQAVEFARSKGLDVSVGSLDSIEDLSPRYHLITLVDVIEHVEDPFSVIDTCRRLLLPGGLLYVKTPGADSLPHRFLGDRWLDSAEHLHFFSRRTLAALLEAVGFEVVSVRQRMEMPTPFLHHELWQEQLYPELLITWIDKLRAGDVIMFLGRRGEVTP